MYEPCHTYEWVISHIWMGHSARHSDECAIWEISSPSNRTPSPQALQLAFLLQTHMRLVHRNDKTHCSEWYDSFIGMTWRIHRLARQELDLGWVYDYSMYDVTLWMRHELLLRQSMNASRTLAASYIESMYDATHESVCRGLFKHLTWLIHVCDVCEAFIYVTRLIHMWMVTHSSVWNDPFICVIWPIHLCDVTYSSVQPDLFICVTWLIHMCDMTHLYV